MPKPSRAARTPTATRSRVWSRCCANGVPEPAARWVHRGLTSQDVVDTALMLCLRDAIDRIAAQVATQVDALVDLAETHRDTPMLARTLTQPALPSTIGVKVAAWLSGCSMPPSPSPRCGCRSRSAAPWARWPRSWSWQARWMPLSRWAIRSPRRVGFGARPAVAHHACADHQGR